MTPKYGLLLRRMYINYKEMFGSDKNDVLVNWNLPFYTKYFLMYKSQITMGWICNTVGKMRSALAVGRETPPKINIAMQYNKRS